MRARHRHFKHQSAGASLALDTRYINDVSDNTTVETWTDRSGNGRNATQATAGNRATYRTAIQGGNGILRFDGTDRYTSTFVNGGAYSLYCVYKRTSSNSNNINNISFVASAGQSGGQATSARRYQLTYDDASGNIFSVFTRSTTGANIARNNDWNIHSVSAAVGTGDKVYLLNGANEQTVSVSSLGSVTGTVRMVIAGTSWDFAFPYVGDMGLLATYETAHSASLRRRIEQHSAYSFKISCN